MADVETDSGNQAEEHLEKVIVRRPRVRRILLLGWVRSWADVLGPVAQRAVPPADPQRGPARSLDVIESLVSKQLADAGFDHVTVVWSAGYGHAVC